MSREKDVDDLVKHFLAQAKKMNEQGGVPGDELNVWHLSICSTMLCEIAKSLAVIADKIVESEPQESEGEE